MDDPRDTISITERIKTRQERIDYLTGYDHIQRSDLKELAQKNIEKYLPDDFMEVWADYITNPRNDRTYKYKIFLPLDTLDQQNNEEITPPSILCSILCSNYNNSKNTLIFGENPPTYADLYDNPYDTAIDHSNLDMYGVLILPEHRTDLGVYGLEIQYKRNIKHGLMVIMQDMINDLIDDYDTLWLDVDEYALKYKVKIKYNYIKPLVIGDFTGILIVLRLCTLDEFNDIQLDSPVPSRCFPCIWGSRD